MIILTAFLEEISAQAIGQRNFEWALLWTIIWQWTFREAYFSPGMQLWLWEYLKYKSLALEIQKSLTDIKIPVTIFRTAFMSANSKSCYQFRKRDITEIMRLIPSRSLPTKCSLRKRLYPWSPKHEFYFSWIEKIGYCSSSFVLEAVTEGMSIKRFNFMSHVTELEKACARTKASLDSGVLWHLPFCMAWDNA